MIYPKKTRNLVASLLTGAGLLMMPTNAFADDVASEAIASGLLQIEGVLKDGAPEAFRAAIAGGENETAAALGHVFFARRHFDAAGWMFGTQAIADEAHAAALSNYAAMAAELHADNPEVFGSDFLMSGLLAARSAVGINPDNPAFQNNLSRLALDASRAAGANAVDEAIAAARAAVANKSENVLFLTNLARALEASGESAEAARIMAMAHALAPAHPAFLAASNTMAGNAGYAAASGAVERPYCDVNFRCQEICPKSIIGGLMSVTCEMENSSAQMACAAGQPYPKSYDCREDLPEYGILIPGLNSGFSLAVPGFSVHVVVNGEGAVDVRVEAGVSVGPVGGYVRGDGHYSPSNGFSTDNLGGGVRVNLVNGGPAGDLASGLGHPPVHIEAESLNGEPPVVAVEGFNVPVITN